MNSKGGSDEEVAVCKTDDCRVRSSSSVLSSIRINSIEGWRTPVCLGALVLIMLLSGAAQADNAKTGTVTGRLALPGGMPVAGSPVFFFNGDTGPPPAPDLYWRIPNRTATTDEDGVFRADIPEGRYYISTVKRNPDRRQRNPRGDEFIHLSLDPEGRPKPVYISAGSVRDLGVIPVQQHAAGRHAATEQITAVEGVISDESERPVAGSVVYAYINRQLRGEPLFVSDSTASDGRYTLRVSGEGTYYLQVRNILNGRSHKIKNRPDENVEVSIRTGEILKGIDIVVIGFPKTAIGQ